MSTSKSSPCIVKITVQGDDLIMNEKLLQETIEQTQKTIDKVKEWHVPYDEQVNKMLEHKELLKQFYKTCKNYEYVQFHIIEVNPTPPHLFKIQVRYMGQPISIITISKDGTITITTEQYNDTNKKTFNCSIQLKDEEWNTKEPIKFMEYFNKPNIPVKAKINETSKAESMLLAEFSKTSSIDKILTGIQPIKFENLYYSIPVLADIAKTVEIKNLTRTKIRKITITELLEDTDTSDTALSRATTKAVFLLNLLHTKEGQQWYKAMGFHGRLPSYITIKVAIAVPTHLLSKCKEFEPFELRAGTDSIEYHHLTYETDGAKIISINTTIND